MKKLLLLILLISMIGIGFWFYRSYQTIGSKPLNNSINNQLNQVETTPSSAPGTNNRSQTTTDDSNQSFILTITNPVDGITVNQSSLTIVGKTAPLASVYINDSQLTADNAGNFSTKITLDEGENIIYILAHDNLGEAAEKEITVTLESQ